LFFLDSCTSPKSRAWLIARKKDIPTRRRDVFLDHNPSLKFIRKQISVLIRKARVEGTALAIGHPYKSTLEALREASVQFRLNEIKVVPASQLMSTPAAARGHAARDG
ncbi:MAG: divergent polysaccharide deacetylase family protein, partial [Syntrophobacteraceae bacterium]